MPGKGPLALVDQVASILDELSIPYALGGSVASSLLGEPRSTVDVDVAIEVDVALGERLLTRVQADFYVPLGYARDAIAGHDSFNLVDTNHALKVDLFVLGDNLLDRMQIERRVLVGIPGRSQGIWVTSAEDQVLRKLDWYRRGGGVSDRQWRDVVGILLVSGEDMDLAYLRRTAEASRLSDALELALGQAGR